MIESEEKVTSVCLPKGFHRPHVRTMLIVPCEIGSNLVSHFILCQRNDDPIEIFVLQ